ncbi:hypothetical protein BX666DRAFT_1961363 [Dichotomocladium elegans]|nr:hypothetical protein BX666DRAFT_1961363 [Dichotomocladium elegans]
MVKAAFLAFALSALYLFGTASAKICSCDSDEVSKLCCPPSESGAIKSSNECSLQPFEEEIFMQCCKDKSFSLGLTSDPDDHETFDCKDE